MKPKVLILGKVPPPYMGPAIATKIILDSSLNEKFELLHLDTRINTTLESMGKWSVTKLFSTGIIYIRLLKMLISHRPALVLIPISQSAVGYLKDSLFIILSALTGRKIVLHLRGSNFRTWLENQSGILKWYVRKTLRMTRGVIVLGNNLRYIFKDVFPEDKIFVCPNGADYTIPSIPKFKSTLHLLYLANLQASKGIEDVLQAMLILKKRQVADLRLDVVGSWRSEIIKSDSLKFVHENSLPVFFNPPDSGEGKFRFFSDADIFVFTPRAPEGHPWVIVEAMAAGLPVISTDQGAIAESVINGENGFIVATNNPGEIASKIEILAVDAELRERMGKSSRMKYEQSFTEAKMVERLANTFNKVIHAG
jgi:glycosyltransferase involved in cell wall biosynthesis